MAVTWTIVEEDLEESRAKRIVVIVDLTEHDPDVTGTGDALPKLDEITVFKLH